MQCHERLRTIPAGGQTAYQWTAGDFVQSAIFTNIPTNSVTDLTANWIFQDYLSGFTETWNVYLNNTLVAAAVIPDCGGCGTYGTVTGTVNFADVAPLNGGYQIELILQNTIPPGEARWLGRMAESPACPMEPQLRSPAA